MRVKNRRRNTVLAFEGLEDRTLLTGTPNDPLYSEQWALSDSGIAAISAPDAWNITTGSTSDHTRGHP